MVTDAAGNTDTASERFRVRTFVRCRSDRVTKVGSWRVHSNQRASGGSYCAGRAASPGKDVLRLRCRGPRIAVLHGDSSRGGRAAVFIDGERLHSLSFRDKRRLIDFGERLVLRKLGTGRHTIRIESKRKRGFVEGLATRR